MEFRVPRRGATNLHELLFGQFPIKSGETHASRLEALREAIDKRNGLFMELADAHDLGAYLELGPARDDEEILTEPLLADLLERVLGYPVDAYFHSWERAALSPTSRRWT